MANKLVFNCSWHLNFGSCLWAVCEPLQHIQYQFKKEEIEFPIIHRINSVFRRATNKWKVEFKLWLLKAFIVLVIDSHRCARLLQDDIQLWLSHIAFCKKWVSTVFFVQRFSIPDTCFFFIFCHDTDACPGCLLTGHQKPDQQSLLLHARHSLWQAG